MNVLNQHEFSVIIPTLWKSKVTLDLLHLYDKCKIVNEIIVIDNDKNNRPENLNAIRKLTLIETDENLYVNESWNIGVDQARNELVALSNDDIIFEPDDMFSFVSKLDNFGAIGMSHLNFKNAAREISLEDGHDVGQGWGCLIFVKKSNWVRIPLNIKVWFGDSWIVNTCKTHSLSVMKLKSNRLIETKMSTSSGCKSFEKTIKTDILEWEMLNRKLKEDTTILLK